MEKIASKLSSRAPKSSKIDEEVEEPVDIDLLDNSRVILFDGKVMKKSKILLRYQAIDMLLNTIKQV